MNATALSALDVYSKYARARGRDCPIIGLAGAQGSGKSTIAARFVEEHPGAVTLSLDDFYVTRAERQALAARVHPLFVTRGPPGTHDLTLLGETLDRLRAGDAVALPVFDKLADDRAPLERWRGQNARPSIILLEGWCVGALPESEAALGAPVNALEREEDREGIWRRCANTALAGSYQTLFGRLDAIVFLCAPSFDAVLDWRSEQEASLRGRALTVFEGHGMARFIAHYERLTRHMIAGGVRADATIQLDAGRGAIRKA